jgi:hypothetical protein
MEVEIGCWLGSLLGLFFLIPKHNFFNWLLGFHKLMAKIWKIKQ